MRINPVAIIKSATPRGLLGRFLIILVVPLVVLQIVSVYVFFGTHWELVTRRLSASLAGDIGNIIEMMRVFPGEEARKKIFDSAATTKNLQILWEPGELLLGTGAIGGMASWSRDLLGHSLENNLLNAMEPIGRPVLIDFSNANRSINIRIQMVDGILDVTVSGKRLYSPTTMIFVFWMVGTSLFMFSLATLFMRIQVRAMIRLAKAADSFGKGRKTAFFKPEGAAEVRQAGRAFIAMQKRIERQVNQRTEMLAGISHDLRTPITRMKLQLAMMKGEEIADLQSDLTEMEQLIEIYLSFVRGEGEEETSATDILALLQEIIGKMRKNNAQIDFSGSNQIILPLRPQAMTRCIWNLIENSNRYATRTVIDCQHRNDYVEVIIDDDGPGIPEDKREEVFRAFIRLEGSRNQKTGGVGLGLTIARDIARAHGGEIFLEDSPLGGLRVSLRLPY